MFSRWILPCHQLFHDHQTGLKNFSVVWSRPDPVGSTTRIIHLHGELVKARGTRSVSNVVNIGYDPINLGDKCPAGSQLRPHIVWFGEAVPAMSIAEKAMALADVVLVIGTSLQVYPAAGLVNAAPPKARRFLVDPNLNVAPHGYRVIAASAEIGVPQLTSLLEI